LVYNQDIGIDNILKYINLGEEDVVLYLGGRIDDDKLYPSGYRRYLNAKIKKLNPTKIIAHTHWYPKKYYERGILDDSAKIDMALAYHEHFRNGTCEPINPKDYENHREYIKKLLGRNPNMIYAMYDCGANNYPCEDTPIKLSNEMLDYFGVDYDLNNIKYFFFNRTYFPERLMQGNTDFRGPMYSTDGFAMINSFIEAGHFLNIIGFSAFGADEDQSYHSAYREGRLAGVKYFDQPSAQSTENQRAEADVLQYYAQEKKINNLEDYDKLMYFFKRHGK